MELRSTRLDDTGVHQLLDLLSDRSILQVVLQRLRIFLGLLQNLLHDRVRHDLLSNAKKAN